MAASDNVSPVTLADATAAGGEDKVLTNTTSSSNLVTRAYNLAAAKVYRRNLVWDPLATVKGTRLSHRGAIVQFNFVNDLDDDPTTAALDENYDVLPTPLESWDTDVTMSEYGRVVTTTALLRGTSMIPLDPEAAERVGRNAGAVIDRLAFAAVLEAGGVNNDGSAGAAPVEITGETSPSDVLRAASQTFKEKDVPTFANGKYTAVMTPACETALRKEADAAGWRYWQINQEERGGSGDITNGMVGAYEGFNIIVANTPQLDTVGAVFLGAEALAKAHSTAPGFGANPQVVVSPVVDRLKRFASVGWYHLVGYKRYRAEAIMTGDLTTAVAP